MLVGVPQHLRFVRNHCECEKIVQAHQRLWKYCQYKWVLKVIFCVNSSLLISKFFDLALKYSASRSIFGDSVRLEWKLTFITFFAIVKATPIFGIVPWAIYIFFVYFTTDAGYAAFELPTPMWWAHIFIPVLRTIQLIFFSVIWRYPFDWRNPFGFSMALATLYVMLSYILQVGTCAIALGMGLYLYAIAMSECIKQNLLAISQCCRSKTESDKKLVWEQFIEYIGFDSSAKR